MSDFYKDSYKIRKYELFSLSVCNVGHQKCDRNHHWGPGSKDHYLIHHMKSGTMRIRKTPGNIPGSGSPETMPPPS